MLFEQGDTDHEHVYLLNGSIVLLQRPCGGRQGKRQERHGAFPLAHQPPRKQSARAKSDADRAHRQPVAGDALARTQTVDYQVSRTSTMPRKTTG